MPILDASVVVSFCLPDDINHEKAVLYFNEAARTTDSHVAPDLIFLELTSALKRRGVDDVDVKDALGWLEIVLSLRDSCDELIDTAKHIASKTGIRAADAFYAACAHENDDVLVTFDKDQAERSQKFGIEVRIL
jgi:predicted nucleic acid-binding protein